MKYARAALQVRKGINVSTSIATTFVGAAVADRSGRDVEETWEDGRDWSAGL